MGGVALYLSFYMPILTWKEYKKRFSGNESCTYFDEAPLEIMRELMKLHGFRLLDVYKYKPDHESAYKTVRSFVPDRLWVTVVYREHKTDSDPDDEYAVEIYIL